MHYSLDPNSVNAERFKPSGKRYNSWQLKLPPQCSHIHGANRSNCTSSWDCFDMHALYSRAYEEVAGAPLGEGWMLVIMEPYNKNGYPIMLIGGAKGKS